MTTQFAVVSSALPPEPSGQAIALGRILAGVDPRRYLLISRPIWFKPLASRAGGLAARRVEVRDIFTRVGLPFLSRSYFLDDAAMILSLAMELGRVAREERLGLMTVCTADLYLLPAAWLAGRLYGIRYIPYLFDDYAYQWSGRRRMISTALEPVVMKGACGVICVNDTMAMEYKSRYGVESEIIYNPGPGLLPPAAHDSPRGTGETSIVYAGAVYEAHYGAMRNMAEAITGLDRGDVYFDIYTQQHSQAKAAGIDGPRVRYHPYQDNASIRGELMKADILFLPMAFKSGLDRVIQTASPAKMSEYLSTGRPILAHAPEGSFAVEYLRRHECGACVMENDPAALRRAIGAILDGGEYVKAMTTNALTRAMEDFDAEKMTARFLRYLEDRMPGAGKLDANGSGAGKQG